MLKCLILYFSQKNTTARVAESIADGLRRAGNTVDLCNLKEDNCRDLSDYDLVGIGAPVYYFRPPFNILEFIKGLPQLNKQRFFIFLLHGTYSWNAGDYIKRSLVKKDAEIVGYFQCRGADYFYGYLKLGYLFSPSSPTDDDLVRGENFGFEIGNNRLVLPQLKKSPFVYNMEKIFTNRWLTQNIYYRLFNINKQKCNKCGICSKVCPTKNIKQSESGFPVWSKNCLLCLMCEMKCPRDAIKSPVSLFVFRPFLLYNVHSAANDSALENVKVIHKNGQTKIIDKL